VGVTLVEGILEDVDRLGLRRREQPAGEHLAGAGELDPADAATDANVQTTRVVEQPGMEAVRRRRRRVSGSRTVAEQALVGERQPSLRETQVAIEIEPGGRHQALAGKEIDPFCDRRRRRAAVSGRAACHGTARAVGGRWSKGG